MNSLNALIVELVTDLRDARQRTLALVRDLTDRQLSAAGAVEAAEVDGPLWELGHVAWFQERWTVRELGHARPLLGDADKRFDSSIAFRDRRRLALPSREATLRYLGEVLENVVASLWRREVDDRAAYLHRLVTAHEDLHGEALIRARYALELPAPALPGELIDVITTSGGLCKSQEPVLHALERAMSDELAAQLSGEHAHVRIDATTGQVVVTRAGVEHRISRADSTDLAAQALLNDLMARLSLPDPRPVVEPATTAGACPGDVDIPGGRFLLGASRDEAFALGSERWAHEVDVQPFRMARAPVTQAEFAEFVEAGGYTDDRWWSREGRRWRDTVFASQPGCWSRGSGGAWYRKHYDALVPLEPHRPMTGVCWHEAEAFCAWAGRRLPTEAEWEFAASVDPTTLTHGRALEKRRYPWGDAPPDARRAHLDLASNGTVDVNAYRDGDSAFGVRQMIGNVWEWTASDFVRYPGEVAGDERQGSPHKVLRGGSFATRARVARSTLRGHHPPERRDVLAGFRTVAIGRAR